jgi:hypothetical protein
VGTNHEKSVIGRFGVRRHRLGLIYLLLAAGHAVIVSLGTNHDYTFAVEFGLLGLAWIVIPVTEIAPTGVRLPTFRPWHRQVLWSDVTAVITPQRWDADQWLRLRLADGELVTLKNVPSERATDIASFAGVPTEVGKDSSRSLDGSQAAARSHAVSDPDRPLTEKELARRFADIAERNRTLQEQLRHPVADKTEHDGY